MGHWNVRDGAGRGNASLSSAFRKRSTVYRSVMSALLRPRLAWLLALSLIAQTACSPADSSQEAASAPEAATATASAPSLEAATALGVRNAAMPLPGLVVGGQLTPEQLDGLAAAGFQNFISLRGAEEQGAGWEEAHAGEASIAFQRLPIAGGDGLSREAAEELARLLDAAGEGTVLYCGSSNRVGALLALKAFYVDGQDGESALELGRAAGMRSLEPRVREIVDSRED
jgi:protein tyrosine phosphatase (PTP) superfamily phosphohydrolase (DUF442 family)